MRKTAFRSVRTWIFLVAAATPLPGVANAQACLGSPALPGQTAIGAAVSFYDQANGYGGGFITNVLSPFAIGVNAQIADIDDLEQDITGIEATVAYELPVPGFSACPFVGVGRLSFGDQFQTFSVDVTRWAFPLGLAVGIPVPLSNNLTLIPSGSVNLLYFRDEAEASAGEFEFSQSDSDTAVGGSFGGTVGVGQLFGRGAVTFTNEEGSEAVYTIVVGVRF